MGKLEVDPKEFEKAVFHAMTVRVEKSLWVRAKLLILGEEAKSMQQVIDEALREWVSKREIRNVDAQRGRAAEKAGEAGRDKAV